MFILKIHRFRTEISGFWYILNLFYMLIFWLWFYKDYGSKEEFGLRPQYLIKKG